MPQDHAEQDASSIRVRSLLFVHFDIVRGCQLRCVGCPNSIIQPRVERIRADDFATCLGNIDVKAIGVFRLFNYGEPLLHPGLADLLPLLTRQRWRAREVELSTNAQFVDWPVLEAAMATGVLTRLVVSCDGDGTPASYEALRPPSRWSKLTEFLTRAAALRDRVAPRLQLMTRTICDGAEGQARWRALLEPLGWRPEFRGWLGLPGSVLHRQGAFAPGQGVCIYMKIPNQLYVDMDGTVVPCCAHPRAGEFGNLRHQRFSEIVAGAARREFHATLGSQRDTMPSCASCGF